MVMRFTSKRGLKMKKMKKNVFCKLESLLLFLLFFHYSFSFDFKNNSKIEVTFP